ncbi:related to YAP1802 - Yeast Adaptor Protein, member of AP180 protein family [Cephalotrichum gorgonifer]|uniref:Related to YAP1802 - Yeast Adaptor Protein, member of AP180 protein family n=1 Tax=Cephalotrichum gorgonifer TaxID=2041049 RepID=A0AAE8MZQ1_9PEZI|nr:related to YAP1802 - Yeast Adaptor Protein, member of AP180 protein family [Cephalotrichum gorgonifer]
MSSSFEKSVKGATKVKAAPPKTKYIEHILVATHSGEAGVGDVFRALQSRLRDSTWTIVFKSLITVHLMIREGRADVTLAYLAKHPNILVLSPITDAQTQGRNIRHYARYLSERARAFRETKVDWVRAKESRLENLSVEKGVLRETEAVQVQISALLSCDVMDQDPENEITITVFRLLVLDLLALFQVLNQGLINILGHFFEMSRPDVERAMAIYRKFTKQTDYVVRYLGVARQFEHHTRVEVPKLKHAPVNLAKQLEEYLRDPDFETHRRQYLAELDAKKKSGRTGGSSSVPRFKTENSTPAPSKPAPNNANGSQPSKAAQPAQPTKAPDRDLIDFFESIEQNQTPMDVQTPPQAAPQVQAQTGMQFPGANPLQQAQPTGYAGNGIMAQPTGYGATNPFQQQQQPPQQIQPAYTGYAQQAPQLLQPNFTGAGFGFTPQTFQPGGLGTIPQDSVASYQTGSPAGQSLGAPQTTNPFRASMMISQQPTGQPSTLSLPTSPASNRLSTNPFAQGASQQSQPTGGTFPQQQQQQPAPLVPMATGTNPFAKTSPVPQTSPVGGTPTSLAPQPTGATNPFRQSTFVNHNTGMGWQHTQTPIGGGLDQVPTIPVFPRPDQQAPWQR